MDRTHVFPAVIIITIILLQIIHVKSEITYIEARYPVPGEPSPPGSPWPYPRIYEPSNDLLTIDPNTFSFTAAQNQEESCDVIREAFRRYKRVMFHDASIECDIDLQDITALDIQPLSPSESIECNELYPSLESDEIYELTVQGGKSILRTTNQWGVLRGLETFSQLLYITEDNMYQINASSISDLPRFKHRGIQMDTSRHFIPVKLIKMNLDAMSYNKFNVLHWHIVDDQSFPYQSTSFPELSNMGAYTSKHVYSANDVKSIIEYARLRGIRVIPEFDTPGHTQSWAKSHPELITPCWMNGHPYQRNGTWHAEAEMLNPILNQTYEFVLSLLEEVANVFPDQYLHLGMDEAYYYCWMSNPNISEFMSEHNLTDYSQLEQYYAQRVLDSVKQLGKSYIVWQDPVDNGAQLQEDAVIQVWKNKSDLAPTASKGYKMILSAGWYLNYIHYPPTWLTPDWKDYYNNDPQDFPGTVEHRNNMVGGEACLWAEYIDQTNFLPTLWPRASAVAERLWSSRDVNDTDNAAFRLDQQRCRLLRRGIPAKPILNGYCGEFEVDMDFNMPLSIASSPISSYIFKINLLSIFIAVTISLI